jgi:secondary thiamine-phosphate synthase enzyme
MIELIIKSRKKFEFIDITKQIKEQIGEVSRGLVTLFVPHTTAGIVITRSDELAQADIQKRLGELVPNYIQYENPDGFSEAIIKSIIVGIDKRILIINGKLALGIMQRIYFCEFNGPQRRKIYMKIIKG